MSIKYEINRLEARVIPELDGRENVVLDLVVGIIGVNGVGLAASRDTLLQLPEPDDESWVPFEDIDEAWCAAHVEKATADKKWKDSIEREIEGLKSKLFKKPFSFQQQASGPNGE